MKPKIEAKTFTVKDYRSPVNHEINEKTPFCL